MKEEDFVILVDTHRSLIRKEENVGSDIGNSKPKKRVKSVNSDRNTNVVDTNGNARTGATL